MTQNKTLDFLKVSVISAFVRFQNCDDPQICAATSHASHSGEGAKPNLKFGGTGTDG